MSRRTSAAMRRGRSARQRSRAPSEIRGSDTASTDGSSTCSTCFSSFSGISGTISSMRAGDRCRHTAASASGWCSASSSIAARFAEAVDEVGGLRGMVQQEMPVQRVERAPS